MSGATRVKAAVSSPPQPNRLHADLRLLATTDIHMQLLGHDYVSDSATPHAGLAGVATLVKDARQEARSEGRGCVLLDNGDFLQGNALGDWLTRAPVTGAHPAVASINALEYDALGIGNHDLDYGLPYLRQIAGHLHMPMVCSNLRTTQVKPVQTAALIDCALPERDGIAPPPLRLGILSVLPALTATWNRHVLKGQARVTDALKCLCKAVPALRKQGADLVIVLAHLGIAENRDSALEIARTPGVDAIIAGHTHRRFPGLDHRSEGEVNAENGTLANCPAIMPGYAGSDLAVLDLHLTRGQDGSWQVSSHRSQLRSNGAKTKPHVDIVTACRPAHLATRAHLSTAVGHITEPLHNYFALAQPSNTQALTAWAKARVVRDGLRGTQDADLPLLSAASAHTAGGLGGPSDYLHIPAGPVLRRHLAGLNPYANEIWALRIRGVELRNHLEHSARIFARQNPGQDNPRLENPDIPAFNLDTIFGVTYRIDPTQPFNQRISHLRYANRPVGPDQTFILVTNQFRAAGGGGYARLPGTRVVLRSRTRIEDALIDAFANPLDKLWEDTPPWRFACKAPLRTVLQTSPAALPHLGGLTALAPEYLGTTASGFARLRLTL